MKLPKVTRYLNKNLLEDGPVNTVHWNFTFKDVTIENRFKKKNNSSSM